MHRCGNGYRMTGPSLRVLQRRAHSSRLLTVLALVISFACALSGQSQSQESVTKSSVNANPPSTRSTPVAPAPSLPENSDKPLSPAEAAVASSSGDLLRSLGAKVDVQAERAEVLAHLAAVTRNYRMSVSLTQKVGEPADAIYREQSIASAKIVSSYAFQMASADARLMMMYAVSTPSAAGAQAPGEFQRIQEALTSVTEKIDRLKAETKSLEDQITRLNSTEERKDMRARLGQSQAALEFNQALEDALVKVGGTSDPRNHSEFEGEMERLRKTAPGMTDITAKAVPAQLAVLDVARSSGIMSQTSALFELLTTRKALEEQRGETALLHRQALSLQKPSSTVLFGMIHEGEALSQQLAATTTVSSAPHLDGIVGASPDLATMPIQTTEAKLNAISAAMTTLSASAVPLSQEIIALESSDANLIAWQTAVNVEYHDVRRSLVQRLLVVVIALSLILVIDKAWHLASVHYVKDLRRRRQLLGMRRLVTVVLCAVVLIFGLGAEFNSFATFAGFIAAGLAVALQTILLSVAAYFFVVGRYGIRIGDRISVASVTGDVIDVGLLRFYLMELAMSGLGFQPTGRVAIFSNAILFLPGVPLYKQMPGTDYAWHEMTVMLKQGGDYTHVVEALLGVVQLVYDAYKNGIEQQYNDRQSTMDYGMNAPRLQSRLQLVGGGGPQLTIRFPVKVREASRITQDVAEALLQLIRKDETISQAVESQPVITAAVKF